LVVDYECRGILDQAAAFPGLERCIVVISPQQLQDLSPLEQSALQSLCREHAIKILEKPVNRHALNHLLHT
jgi:hypothetical protein